VESGFAGLLVALEDLVREVLVTLHVGRVGRVGILEGKSTRTPLTGIFRGASGGGGGGRVGGLASLLTGTFALGDDTATFGALSRVLPALVVRAAITLEVLAPVDGGVFVDDDVFGVGGIGLLGGD
jgi:hypothetical protein